MRHVRDDRMAAPDAGDNGGGGGQGGRELQHRGVE